MSRNQIKHRLARLHATYERRLAELDRQRERARLERLAAWERLSRIRSEQADMDLSIGIRTPHAPAYSWQMERRQEAAQARRQLRLERAERERTRARAQAERDAAQLSDMEVWAQL